MTHHLRYPREEAAFERDVAAVRARLPAAAFRAAWAEGEQLSPEQAAAYALEDSAGLGGAAGSGGASAGPASARPGGAPCEAVL